MRFFLLDLVALLATVVFLAPLVIATPTIQPRADRTITKTTTVTKATRTVTKTTTKTLTKVTITKTTTKTLTKPAVTKTATKTLTKPAVTKTATVTKPASTVVRTSTLPVSVRTVTTTQVSTIRVTQTQTETRTATASVFPETNVPNGMFEQQPDTAGWCNNVTAATAICSLVNQSRDGTFTGSHGPGMLAVLASNSEGRLSDFGVPVSIVSTPNPSGRDWTLTARFRSLPGNPGNCWPIMGWMSATGIGYGYQPDPPSDGWHYFSRTLPNSANGRSERWEVYVTAGCFPGGPNDILYVDSVVVD